MTRGSPAVNVTAVSEGGGPVVSSTMASASGIARVAGGRRVLAVRGRASARRRRRRPRAQSQLAGPQSPRDIPVIDSLAA